MNKRYLNPYRVGLKLIIRRLRWDLSYSSWVHRKKIRSISGAYSGKKAVIMCNGPGLRNVSLGLLNGVYTFGLNNINNMFGETCFRPSAIVAVNPLVIRQNSDFYSKTNIPLFLDSVAKDINLKLTKRTYLLHSSDYPYFSKDCEFSLFQGFSVTYVAMQLAYHMGFSQVALVGCDHHYTFQGEPNSVSEYDSRASNHFGERYYSDSSQWQLPDLRASEYFFDVARREFTKDGRLLVNCSSPSNLVTLPRMELEDFLLNGA